MDGCIGLMSTASQSHSIPPTCITQKYGNNTAVLKGLKTLVTKAGDLATTAASAMTSQQLDTAVQLLKDSQLSVVKSNLDAKAAQKAAKQVQLLAQLAAEVLTVPAGGSAVVSNGRLLVDHTPGGLPCLACTRALTCVCRGRAQAKGMQAPLLLLCVWRLRVPGCNNFQPQCRTMAGVHPKPSADLPCRWRKHRPTGG